MFFVSDFWPLLWEMAALFNIVQQKKLAKVLRNWSWFKYLAPYILKPTIFDVIWPIKVWSCKCYSKGFYGISWLSVTIAHVDCIWSCWTFAPSNITSALSMLTIPFVLGSSHVCWLFSLYLMISSWSLPDTST